MKRYNINTNIIRVIRNLYDKATSAALFNSSIGDWLRTTVGARQGCLLSPTLFNIFMERIMTDVLEDNEGTVSIGGRKISNLCFANDINGLAGEEEELSNLVERLDKASTAYEDLLMIVKRRKLQWYGHVSRSSGLAKTSLQGTVKGKKTRQTEEEVGRQHQRMDRPGDRQVPEGSGEQGKMEETGCEIICGAPTTLAVER